MPLTCASVQEVVHCGNCLLTCVPAYLHMSVWLSVHTTRSGVFCLPASACLLSAFLPACLSVCLSVCLRLSDLVPIFYHMYACLPVWQPYTTVT